MRKRNNYPHHDEPETPDDDKYPLYYVIPSLLVVGIFLWFLLYLAAKFAVGWVRALL